MVIDVDVKSNEENKGMSCVDAERAGLPEPSLIVQTPSGSFHVYFYFEHTRAFPATLGFYKRIQQEIAMGIGGDLCAIGAER